MFIDIHAMRSTEDIKCMLTNRLKINDPPLRGTLSLNYSWYLECFDQITDIKNKYVA